MHNLCRWRSLLPSALVLCLALVGLTRAGDSLDDVKARQEVDARRIQADVDAAEKMASRLADAKKLREAVSVLREALDKVRESTSLPEDRRKKLERELEGMIRQFDPATAVVNTPRPPVTPRTPVDDGKGPSTQAGSIIGSRAGQLSESRAIREERAQGMLLASNSVYKSSILPAGDYNLPSPAEWERISKRINNVKMTEKERAILSALNKTRTVEFKGETFQDVINYLQKSTGQTIVVPRNVLEEAGVTLETPIKLEMKDVTTRTVLKKMLAELNLTYIIKDEAIEITTPERARLTLTTRTYYVGDLLAAVTNPRLPPVYNQAAVAQNIQQLGVMIMNTYDPDSWQSRGGPGTITFDPVSKSFIVRQTAELHLLMGVGMR